MLSDGTVVAVETKDRVRKLTRFNVKERRVISGEELKDNPLNLTEITLGGKPAIAIPYS